jgi:hypothetical protein
MSLKRLGIALFAALALGGLTASSAFAVDAVETDVSSWTAGGVKLAQNTPAAIKCSKTAASENLKLVTTVAEAPFELEATGVSCSEAKITNITVAGIHMAVATGKLTFTGVAIVKPNGSICEVEGGMIKTNLLEWTLQMGKAPTNSTPEGFIELKPDAAAGVTSLGSVTILGCSLEGSYKLGGIIFLKTTLNTKEDAVVQEVNANTTTAAMSSVTWGTNPASVIGEIAIELNSGAVWGATNE